MTTTDLDPSRYVSGAAAPVDTEVTAHDLPVTGHIPEELEGRWLRIGPNPITAPDLGIDHWFRGDGMVHGVRIRGGMAEWYRNRWVRADRVAAALGEEAPEGPSFGEGRTERAPNTNVGVIGGRTWAIGESGPTPVELTYDLDTIGRNDFDGTLKGPFTAHPKLDPLTGDLHAMCYSWPDLITEDGPVIHYLVVGPDAQVRRTVAIPMNNMTMVHDMSLTENWALIYDLPVTVNLDLVAQGRTVPVSWNPDHEPRVGLLPRGGEAGDVVWCPVDPCYVFHPLNAYEDADGNIVADVCRADKVFDRDLYGPLGDSLPNLYRWTINPKNSTVAEECVDDRPQDFPRHNPRFGTRQHQFGYTSGLEIGPAGIAHSAIYKTDYKTGTIELHDFGPGRGGAEPVFVPRANSTAEEDGWLLTVVYDQANDSSELHILDATDITAPAVAAIGLPQRVPVGFHGNWCPDTADLPAL